MDESLNNYATLGERVLKRRTALGISLRDAAREIKTSPEYIEAVERDDLGVFSAKVYARGFFAKLVKMLQFEDAAQMLKEFDREWEVQTYRKDIQRTRLPENRGPGQILTPWHIWAGITFILVLVFFVFFGAQLFTLLGAPKMEITAPADRMGTDARTIRVAGVVEREGALQVNGRELAVNADGTFDELIELVAGPNRLEFFLKHKFGGEAREVRYVYVQ